MAVKIRAYRRGWRNTDMEEIIMKKQKMTAALICGMLGCLCYGGGDWLMMYGDTAHDGSVYWLTRGVAQIPAWRNTLAMDCAALVLYYDIIRIFMVECGQLCRGGAAAWRGCIYSFFMVSACQ